MSLAMYLIIIHAAHHTALNQRGMVWGARSPVVFIQGSLNAEDLPITIYQQDNDIIL